MLYSKLKFKFYLLTKNDPLQLYCNFIYNSLSKIIIKNKSINLFNIAFDLIYDLCKLFWQKFKIYHILAYFEDHSILDKGLMQIDEIYKYFQVYDFCIIFFI